MGREEKASDLHISAGMPLMMRVHGKLEQTLVQPDEQETEVMLYGLLDENQKTRLAEGYDIDFALETPDHNRQRVNVFRQQGKIAATIRLLNSHIPTLEELHMPKLLYNWLRARGLILVTGPTGSGKSTTLAAMIEHINQTRQNM